MGPSHFSSTLFDHEEQSAATKLEVVDHDCLKIYRVNDFSTI
ncbi:50S ribosomal protein L35 [Zea mays]|uniref:50S ribosomal protein L35 n=1 Tax=Zea mays TaxID=4577 RepID=A0A1D6JJM7_MAIZE|nr:50S ribosomal protein L35 [Zea mays]